jgi:amidase
VIALWQDARKALEAAGAEVIEVDFPLVSNCEGDRPGAPTVFTRGLVSKEFLHHELWDLTAWAFDDFLQANGDPALNRLVDVDGALIFPHDPGTLPNREGDLVAGMDEYVRMAERGITPWDQISSVPDGLRGLEKTRRIDLEDWMDRLGLDAVLFPTVADVAPANADVDPASADIAWSNGVWVANGNLAIRHLGVPTVTVPMGVMADIGMPVGLTFAGRAYDDSSLLRLASAFEASGSKRLIPPRTPPLPKGQK